MYSNAFANPKRYKKLRNLWNPNFKKQFNSAQERRCSNETMHCVKCLEFSTNSQDDLPYHIAEKHSAPKPDVTFQCKLCYQELPRFHALRQHKNSQHVFSINTANVDPDDNTNERDDLILGGDLRSCQNFPVDSELELAKHKSSIMLWKTSTQQEWTRSLITSPTT